LILLVAPEEKGLVFAVIELGNADGAPERAAEVVSPAARPVFAATPTRTAARAAADTERIARVEVLVNKIFEAGPMVEIRARLHRRVDYDTAGLPEFGSVVAGLERNFLNSIHV